MSALYHFHFDEKNRVITQGVVEPNQTAYYDNLCDMVHTVGIDTVQLNLKDGTIVVYCRALREEDARHPIGRHSFKPSSLTALERVWRKIRVAT